MEQVEKKQGLSKESFLSIKGQFGSFFESKNHDEDDVEPSNYNRTSVGSQEVYFDTPLGDDNLRAENESQEFKWKKVQDEEATISQNEVFNNMASFFIKTKKSIEAEINIDPLTKRFCSSRKEPNLSSKSDKIQYQFNEEIL